MTAREDMVVTMCQQVDAGDAEGFASWFAVDAVYRFANAEPSVGRASVIDATRGATEMLPWVRHEVDQVVEHGNQLFCRFVINTESPSGQELALPCVTVMTLTDGLVSDYRVHMDITPALRRDAA